VTDTSQSAEVEKVRKSAQEWAQVAEHWMNRHDEMSAFLRADPSRLRAWEAWKSWSTTNNEQS
jgi:ribosomal protein RSM22 (predicted rRNA methylase)